MDRRWSSPEVTGRNYGLITPTQPGKDLLETLAGKEHPMGPVARPGPGNVLRLAGAAAVGLARGPAVELAAQYRWVLAHTGPPEEGRGRVATC